MPEVILKIVLPIIGLVIILFCLGAYFFKYGTRLKDSIQEFKMFGADLKISILTVFILVGLILTFAGTYFTIVDTNSKLTKLLEDEKTKTTSSQTKMIEMQGQLTSLKLLQNKTLNYFLDLDGISEIPNPKNLKVSYKLWGDEDRENTLSCTPITQMNVQRLMITISDLKPESYVTALMVEDLKTGRKWKVNAFYPFSPSLKLNAINQ